MRAAISVNEVVDVSDRLIAMQLALRGDFADELAALKEQRDGLADDLKALGSKDAIAKKIADADAYAARIQKEADDLTAKAADLSRQAAAAAQDAGDKLAAVAARESAVSQAEARLSVRSAQLDKRAQDMAEANNAWDAALTERQQAVERAEISLAAGQKQLINDRAEFNIKLAALRA